MALNPADMIEKYIALRDRVGEIKAKHATELAPFTNVMASLENELLRHLQAMKLDSVKGAAGTAYQSTATSITVDDWPKALDYIREHEAWDLLEARVAKTAAVEIIGETKKPIPGVKISTATVLRVRSS